MMKKRKKFDVIVVGGGHAGCEAVSATARIGCRTVLITQDASRLALMSCNPAIGGLAKGHLVREIDALGGIMGEITDRSSIQCRMLNRSKGPAVWSPRVQCDRSLYNKEMVEKISTTTNLEIMEGEAVDLLIESGKSLGVVLKSGEEIAGDRTILCGGTFWNAVIHVGIWSTPAGRIYEDPAIGISERLEKEGFKRIRLKTGTPPRLDGNSINFSKLERQDSDPEPIWFSQNHPEKQLSQVACYLAYTNEKTHKTLETGLDRSPLYTGRIAGIGPRYCPSIEDKIVRFADKERHQLFLEPEGLNTTEYYINGFSTSLPEDVQEKALKTIPGLEEVRVNRPGYAVEYDAFPANQLKSSLETKLIGHLYFAGQVNGTSGYEEAAAQGLIAGINAARSLAGKDPIVLGRDQAYTGVLIDDLITKVPVEPYRMFTSRAEFRLLLRQDNAHLRLCEIAKDIGLKSPVDLEAIDAEKTAIKTLLRHLQKTRIKMYEMTQSVSHFLKRPEVTISDLITANILPDTLISEVENNPGAAWQAELEIKYEGYLNRQRSQVETFRKMEDVRLKPYFDYHDIKALSNEAKSVLKEVQPATLGQASRLPGVRSADIAVLMVFIRQNQLRK